MKKLSDILKNIGFEHLSGPPDADVSSLAYDSRECSPGSLFFCIPGFNVDGHDFVPEAVSRGASALIVTREVSAPDDVSVIKVEDPRLAMGIASSEFFDNPSQSLFLAGVTGTNGKTSVAFLIDELLKRAGRRTGMLGTVENRIGDEILEVKRTTPESMDLHYLHSRMVVAGCSHAVMEVSSHAVALRRIAGCCFDAAVFTNLSQDHLDFHKDLDAYFDEKKKLFTEYLSAGGAAIINTDDPRGAQLAGDLSCRVVTFGMESPGASVRAVNPEYSRRGIRFTVEHSGESFTIESALGGKFNIYNSLAMIAFGLSQDIPPETICATLADMAGVPGRFEKIEEGQEFTVVVDYAHSPDGLMNVLGAAREICGGKLIVVFGAGGDRDKAKRPLMGAAAVRWADLAVVTSDNPRSEDPVEIIDSIILGVEQELKGLDMSRSFKYFVEPDRFSAIRKALGLAAGDDVVVIAGKGHENYQVFRDRTIHFDDREVARNILREKNGK